MLSDCCDRCGHSHANHIYVQGVPTDCGRCDCSSFIGTVVDRHGYRHVYSEPHAWPDELEPALSDER